MPSGASLSALFPALGPSQLARLERLPGLIREWNTRINLVSRQDVEHLVAHHLVHSLSPMFFLDFPPGATILDFGTGGGLPGIPLAIAYPDCHFHLVDSIAKKVRVVQALIEALALSNATCEQVRGEKLPRASYDYVVSRAVTDLRRLWQWVRPLVRAERGLPEGSPVPGLIAFKGGDLARELASISNRAQVYDLYPRLPDPYYEGKKLIHIHSSRVRG